MTFKYFQARLAGWLVVMLLAPVAAVAADCQMFLSSTQLDYGRLYRAALQDQGGSGPLLLLGRKSFTLNVNCQVPTRLSLRFIAPGDGLEYFRFAGNGRMRIAMSQVTLDGQSAGLAVTREGAAADEHLFLPGQPLFVTQGAGVVAGSRFSAQVDVDTWVADEATRVRYEARLEGGGRFERVVVE